MVFGRGRRLRISNLKFFTQKVSCFSVLCPNLRIILSFLSIGFFMFFLLSRRISRHTASDFSAWFCSITEVYRAIFDLAQSVDVLNHKPLYIHIDLFSNHFSHHLELLSIFLIVQDGALFFRNYWTPDSNDVDGSQQFEIQAFGNTTNNFEINEFLRKFIQIYTVFKRGELFEETYRAVVRDYLSRIG